MTAVVGFACTAGPGQDTHLYMDDVVVDCAVGGPFVVDVAGPVGNQDPPFPGPPNDLDLFFQTAIYRGNEELAGPPAANKAYWNVALGLNAAAFANRGACTVTATATASDGPLTGGATPSGQRWPLVTWSVPLSDASGRVCTSHQLNDGTGVATTYSDVSGHAFYAAYARATEVVSVEGAPPTAAPTALLLAVTATSRPLDADMPCPSGYQRVGAWRAGIGVADNLPDAADYQNQAYDYAWVYVCTTDSARLSVHISASDCGGPVTMGACAATGGVDLGHWHVGDGCDGTADGVDVDGATTVDAGWMALCGHGDALATVETVYDDCNSQSRGCPAGSTRSGQWHTMPGGCTGLKGRGYQTPGINSGWLAICRVP